MMKVKKKTAFIIIMILVSAGVVHAGGKVPQSRKNAPGNDGFGPFRFGMSRDDVKKFKEFEPFLDVRVTGGIETPNGKWNGERKNISFVFDDSGLAMIQIWAYEGRDEKSAVKEFVKVLKYFKAHCGDVESPVITEVNTISPGEFEKKVYSILGSDKYVNVKIQIRPVLQGEGTEVFCSFFRHHQHGYFVFIYYSRK